MESKKVATIIPTYNNVYDTLKAANSVLKSDRKCKIIVVDDASEKEIQEKLKRTLNNLSSEISLLINPKNKGFAASCNVGAEYAIKKENDLLFFLNNDAVVKEDAIRYMVEEFDYPRVAIVGPKIYYENTKIINSVRGFFDKNTFDIILRGINEYDDNIYNIKKNVEYISGCAFMVRSSVFRKYNGFDENYYMYSEEIDFCYKVHNKNENIIFVPEAIVWHCHSKTMGAESRKTIYYLLRNKFYFTKMYGTKKQLFNIIFINLFKNFKTIFLETLKKSIIVILAIYDALNDRMGKKSSKWIN